MTSTLPSTAGSTDPVATAPWAGDRPRSRPAWAGFGVAAGLTAVVSMVGSSLAGAVYDPDAAGDAEALAALMSEQVPQILVFHTATMVSAMTLVVFAAGLHRQLVRRVGADSVLPGVAGLGLVLVAAAQLLGAGLTTEFVFGLADPERMVPETVVFFGHWIATIPWLWAGAGLAGVAVALAARRGAYPRWVGRTSLVLGGLTLLLGISPLQYMAGMTGPVWVLAVATGLYLSRRED